MKFLQRRPCASLRRFVRFYWIAEDPGCSLDAQAESVVPDGCMEMIFHFGAPLFSVHATGQQALQPPGFVGGQIRRSIRLRPTGPVGMLGVRFNPFGAMPLMHLPMDALAGDTVDVVDVFGKGASGIVERLVAARNAGERFDIVESFLLLLAGRARNVNPIARAAVGALATSCGRDSVQSIAARLAVSERKLNRTMHREVGLGTKALARIARLQFALRVMAGKGERTLTEVAHASGYFDQAHFIRDFRDVCGMSPGVFARSGSTLDVSR